MTSNTFEGVTDRYEGITVDSEQEPCPDTEFSNRLAGKISWGIFIRFALYS